MPLSATISVCRPSDESQAIELLAQSDWGAAVGAFSPAVAAGLEIQRVAERVLEAALVRFESDGTGAFRSEPLRFLGSRCVLDEDLWQRAAKAAEPLVSRAQLSRCRGERSLTVGQTHLDFGV